MDLVLTSPDPDVRYTRNHKNPMLAFGPGPDGMRCKDCRHLYGVRYANTYWKCRKRGDSGGPATDHRVRWPACAKFEPKEEP